MPSALPKAIKIDLYCEVLNKNNDLGVFSIPRQASGTKYTWVIIYTLLITVGIFHIVVGLFTPVRKDLP